MDYLAIVRFRHLHYVRRAARRERIFRDRANPFDVYDNEEFRKRFRFTKPTAHFIHNLICDKIKSHTKRNMAIPSHLQMFIALRYYATGSFQITVGDLCNVSQPTVSKIVKRVSTALAELRPSFIKFPNDVLALKSDFYGIDQFPNVIGAIDGTHIKICNPGGEDPARFINRKNFFSINTQVICDSKGRIMNIVARWPGSTHDSRIFNESSVKEKFENHVLSGILIGDQGYPCLPYLMTPIGNPITRSEKRYNKSHVKTRGIIERLFGIWKRRFSVLRLGINTKLQTSYIIVIAVAVLQNIALDSNEPDPDGDEENNDDNDVDHDNVVHNNNLRGLELRRNLVQNHFSQIN